MGSQWFLRKVKFQKKQTGHIFIRIAQKTPTDSLWEICCFPRNGSFSNFIRISFWGTSYDRPHFKKAKSTIFRNATDGQTAVGPHPPSVHVGKEELEEMARELRSACQIEEMDGSMVIMVHVAGKGVKHQPNKGLPAMTSLLHVFVGDVWGGH